MITPRGRREIGRFRAEDDNGNSYVVIEYELIIPSNTIRRDAMPLRSRVVRELYLQDGSPVDKVVSLSR
jgi:hypothetical protein